MQEEPDVKVESDEEAEGAEVDSHLPKPKNLMKDSSTYTIKRCFGGVCKYFFPSRDYLSLSLSLFSLDLLLYLHGMEESKFIS
jgi:hypothetical protein